MKVAFCTLGCKVNQYDTEAMWEVMEAAGYERVDFDDYADVYVINTCTVTQTGDKKSRQMISRAHSRNPGARIVVSGCYAQRAPGEVIALEGVSLVIGNKDRTRIAELLGALEEDGKTNAVGDLEQETTFEPLTMSHDEKTRAHLKIQEGCDRYCSYCVIPYARGRIRSRPPEGVRREFEKLAEAGYCEVVLTGIHLMSYGKDLSGVTLLDAIDTASDIEGIKRIRLGSLEPQLTDDGFVRALAQNPKICRQFHLSLQSGSTPVLKRMNRRYTAEEYAECVKRLREAIPNCAVTTDIIVGFPGETEEEFAQTLEFARRIGFARIHVFPFSRRKGTKAYDMPGQLSNKQKAERAARLIALGHELEQGYLKAQTGLILPVLFEERDDTGYLCGYSDTYVRVRAKGGDAEPGEIRNVKIYGVTQARLDGIIIK